MRLVNDDELRSTIKPASSIECVIEIEGMVCNSHSLLWLSESSLLFIVFRVASCSLHIAALPKGCGLPIGSALVVGSTH